jgi:hypothetical protein
MPHAVSRINGPANNAYCYLLDVVDGHDHQEMKVTELNGTLFRAGEQYRDRTFLDFKTLTSRLSIKLVFLDFLIVNVSL